MPSPVSVIHALPPQKLPSERVEGEAGCALGEGGGGEGDQALQDEGVSFLLGGGGVPEVDRAGGVRRAVEVLPAAVAEVDLVFR